MTAHVGVPAEVSTFGVSAASGVVSVATGVLSSALPTLLVFSAFDPAGGHSGRALLRFAAGAGVASAFAFASARARHSETFLSSSLR